MKKRFKVITSLFCTLALSSATVFGAGIYDVSYDLDTSTVTISGTVDGENKSVTLEVLEKGINTEDLSGIDVSKMSEYIYRIDETSTDENGKFEFKFEMDKDTDEYITRIKTDKIDEDVLLYVNYDEYKIAFDALNNPETDTTDEVWNIINTQGSLLGMVSSEFAGLSLNSQKVVASGILKDRNRYEDKKFPDSAKLLESYHLSTILETINSKDGLNGDILDEYKDILGIADCSANSVYNDFSAEEKTSLVQSLKGHKCTEVTDFIKLFIEKTVLLEIKNTDNYVNLHSILKDNNSVLDLNISAFEALSEYNRSIVLRNITGKSYSSKEALKSAFSNEISEVSKSQGSSGGSSGGGFSSGKQGPTIAVDLGIVNNQQSKPFSDLGNVVWAEESIISLYNKGMVSGKEVGKFYPMDNVKREEFVKMLISGLGNVTNGSNNKFADVDVNMWYAPYVITAGESGIVSGTDEKIFGIGYDITRQDLITILYRVATMKGIEFPEYSQYDFVDKDKISEYANEAVEKLSSVGVINGNENGEFMPHKSATRAEAAVILDKFFELIK